MATGDDTDDGTQDEVMMQPLMISWSSNTSW